jgi:hypothetical protein
VIWRGFAAFGKTQDVTDQQSKHFHADSTRLWLPR